LKKNKLHRRSQLAFTTHFWINGNEFFAFSITLRSRYWIVGFIPNDRRFITPLSEQLTSAMDRASTDRPRRNGPANEPGTIAYREAFDAGSTSVKSDATD
jgi:hypothetical protein